jgi:hypothetical protein
LPTYFLLRKTYGDFKHLSEFLAISGFEFNLPRLPTKRTKSGLKKPGNLLQNELEIYLKEILSSKILVRMLCVRSFFSMGVVEDDARE